MEEGVDTLVTLKSEDESASQTIIIVCMGRGVNSVPCSSLAPCPAPALHSTSHMNAVVVECRY
jgi:hypothetical protein